MTKQNLIKAATEILQVLDAPQKQINFHQLEVSKLHLQSCLADFQKETHTEYEWQSIDIEQFNKLVYEYFESSMDEPFFIAQLLLYTKRIHDILKAQNWE